MTNERPLWVTIPTIGQSEHLVPLLREIEQDDAVDKIILTVNLQEYVAPLRMFFNNARPKIEVVQCWRRGKSLHHGWNFAIEYARKFDAQLAVLNDDISLSEPRAISQVAGLLAEYPSYAIVGLNWQETPESTSPSARPLRAVHGSYRHHGVGGFAWVCDPHKVSLVPDDFVWWYGDDHIFLSAERDGHKIGIASHVHVEHVNALTANSGDHNWTHEAISGDTDAFRRIWPGQ